MSWIAKAENLLNNIDQRAASVLQNQQKHENGSENFQNSQSLPKIPSISKNMLILSKSSATMTPKKASSKVSDLDYDSFSEKSVSSRHTVVDQNEEFLQIKDFTPVETFSAEKELASAKILLSELKIENNELKIEIDSLHDQLKANNHAQKANELESAYAIIMDEKRDLILMNQSLENSNANYIKTISELESNIMKLQQNEAEIRQKLEYARNETKNINIELQNYKTRAQNQLQMKEKLIEQLKSGGSGNNQQLEINSIDDSTALRIEIDQLKNDRDHLESERNLLTKRYEETKNFIEKLEHKHRIMEAAAEDKIAGLNDTINQFILKSTQYEDEMRLQKQEIANIREEMLKQKTFMTTKLHEKENELKRLKNTYRESQANAEIENRVQSLTQSLITKQNNLETITAERNALKLQYEKLSNQHEELLHQMRNQRPQVINMNETDDVKSNFLTINPFDSRMSKKVKRAYSNFDQLGIRVSRYLNRYPLARLFSVFYVCFLHLFVLLVLLQSTPSQ